MKNSCIRIGTLTVMIVLLSIMVQCLAEGDSVPFYTTDSHNLVIEDLTDRIINSSGEGWINLESITDPDGIEYYMSMQEEICLYDDERISVLVCVGTKNLVYCEKIGRTAVPTVLLIDAIEEKYSQFDDDLEKKYTERFESGMIYGDNSGFFYYDFENARKTRYDMTTSPVSQYGDESATFICYANNDQLFVLNFAENRLQKIPMPESISRILYVHPDNGEIIIRGNSGSVYVVDMAQRVFYNTSLPEWILFINADCYVSETDYALKVTTVDGESTLIKKADDDNLKGDMSKLRTEQYGDMFAYIGEDRAAYTVILDAATDEPNIIGGVYSFRINNYMKFQPGLYSTSISGSDLIWIMNGSQQRYVLEDDVKSETKRNGEYSFLATRREAYMQHGVIWTPINDSYGFLGGGYSDHYWVYDGNTTTRIEISFEAEANDGSGVDGEQFANNEESTFQYVVASGGETNVRRGPGLEYDTVGKILVGAGAKFLNNTSVDERGVVWYNIEFEGNNAWVSSRYTSLQENLAQNDQDAENNSSDTRSYVKGTSGDSNVRTGPGLDYLSVGTLHKESTAVFLGEISTDARGVDWYKINYSGGEYWVSSRYTTLY